MRKYGMALNTKSEKIALKVVFLDLWLDTFTLQWEERVLIPFMKDIGRETSLLSEFRSHIFTICCFYILVNVICLNRYVLFSLVLSLSVYRYVCVYVYIYIIRSIQKLRRVELLCDVLQYCYDTNKYWLAVRVRIPIIIWAMSEWRVRGACFTHKLSNYVWPPTIGLFVLLLYLQPVLYAVSTSVCITHNVAI